MMKFKTNIYIATIYQIVSVLFLLWLTRLFFIFHNYDSVGIHSTNEFLRTCFYGLRFDLVAVAYFNILFILLRILPFTFTSNRFYLHITDAIYYITNSLLLAINIGDTPFFRFTGSRLRWSTLMGITADPNWGGEILACFGAYWSVFLGAAFSIVSLIWLYKRVDIIPNEQLFPHTQRCRKIIARTAAFLLLAGATFLSMRGRIGNGVPLSIADAEWYIREASQINAVLNSPFCIVRSLNKHNEIEPLVFFSDDELAEIRSSLHKGKAGQLTGKNIMVITIESGGSVWFDSLCRIPNNDIAGCTPFLDSLISKSLSCRHTVATGIRSVEGITAIYGGFPMFTPFIYMLSPYNSNMLDAPARLLKNEGYSTIFYFGCNHGSFHIDQTAHASGFSRIIDREIYGDDSEFDGHWGIFDHAMGEYAAEDLSTIREPFFAGWFTLNAHNPFTKPEHWHPDGYLHPEASAQRGMEYTDRALRHFFEIAKQQKWYNNTIFVITADHGNRDLKNTPYDTPYIKYLIPFILYTPDGSIEPGHIDDRMMTQFDIAPTILGLVNYPHDYIALGTDLFDTQTERYAIGFTDNQYRVTGLRYVVLLSSDATTVQSVFDIAADPLMTSSTNEFDHEEIHKMVHWAQAFLQDYTQRIINDQLSIQHEHTI